MGGCQLRRLRGRHGQSENRQLSTAPTIDYPPPFVLFLVGIAPVNATS